MFELGVFCLQVLELEFVEVDIARVGLHRSIQHTKKHNDLPPGLTTVVLIKSYR